MILTRRHVTYMVRIKIMKRALKARGRDVPEAAYFGPGVPLNSGTQGLRPELSRKAQSAVSEAMDGVANIS